MGRKRQQPDQNDCAQQQGQNSASQHLRRIGAQARVGTRQREARVLGQRLAPFARASAEKKRGAQTAILFRAPESFSRSTIWAPRGASSQSKSSRAGSVRATLARRAAR